ncbi:MAG TPA: hypothetical protein VG347_24580 [Verrucomicrobiae bacterium]|nr:hypothetical protein [Verrucomicrobiae bacterium]
MKTKPENQTVAMRQPRDLLRKRIPSMLDPFVEPLLQMERENKTIDQMLDWLKERDVVTARGNLSKFLRHKCEERDQKEVTDRLNGEKNIYLATQRWIKANPNPELEAVIERLKTLAMNLTVAKDAPPEALRLADRLAWTATRFANDRNRADYRTRKLVMEEAKHAEWVKCEQARGLEFCLNESKKYPAVADMFRATYAALKEAQTAGISKATGPCRSGGPSRTGGRSGETQAVAA